MISYLAVLFAAFFYSARNKLSLSLHIYTQEARISRKTFYRHFSDKDEALEHLFDSLYKECLSSITGSEVITFRR